ncbi:MAG TPA: hypothetical protein VGS21_08515, partial [Acidimicrobiales bacterium]|nr:hypothetical protein [Acidimicrobiales bacterium]
SQFKSPSEYGEAIEAFFRSLSEPHREKARLSGTFERSGAYLFDGFLDLVRGERTGARAAAKSAAKVIVRVDKAALERGAAAGEEICEMRRSGPLAVSAVDDLIQSGAFLAVVVAGREGAIERVAHLGSSKKARALLLDAEAFANEVESKGVQVKGACHGARNLNAYEQTALEFLSPDCVVKGCGNDLFLERDHRIDWSHTHVTRFDEIDRLCSFHHDLKTRGNWMLVEGRGKRAMVPPDDPRHPRNRPPPSDTS